MRYAYADPPYFGYCGKYDHEHGLEGLCWDEIGTHRQLVAALGQFDGWAMSCTSGNLRDLLPICPPDVRVMAWVKPFASFKPGVNPAYAWEPVIVRGCRKRTDRTELTVRDWVSTPITLRRGLTGAKPEAFCQWIFDVLGITPADEFVDLFHGSGAVARAWERRTQQLGWVAS